MRRLGRIALVTYLLLLGLSHLLRLFDRPDWESIYPGRESTTTEAVVSERRLPGSEVRLSWIEWPAQTSGPGGPEIPIVLVHGSPGDAANFRRMAPWLAERGFRVLAPDLPGFGASSHDVPDYSFRAHADYVVQWLDELGIERAHLLGFSMGGGVVLELWRQDPERVASMVLFAAIGVQELELLGSYHLNHVVHGLQLAALWGLRDLTPHFGVLDRFPLDVPYARNFFDSDQRPLRRALLELEPPALVIHGEHDPLVPAEAAREHHRLLPHSELLMLDASHFFVFDRERSRAPAEAIADFALRAENGEALRRSQATAERVELSQVPWDPTLVPPWQGPALASIVLLLALSTFVSEDLTCLSAGLLVAQGRLSLFAASLGCFLGIVIGDFALFWLGRLAGRPALRVPPLSWWVTQERIDESSAWLEQRGAIVIFLSRFMPGARLPTYVAAGMLRTSFLRFALWFVLAAGLWTPLFVLVASQVGEAALDLLGRVQNAFLWGLAILAVVMVTVQRLLLPLFTHRGRRRLLGRFKRWTSWEFWPIWLVYPPVVLWILWLGLRHRSLTLFTAANPAMPAGGWVGESKDAIYRDLESSRAVPSWSALPTDLEPAEKPVWVERFLAEHSLDYPVVLKPDAGQRGAGVLIAKSRADVERYFAQPRPATLVQEYAPGAEFGIFYYRLPGESVGRLFAITEKIAPILIGDGKRTLEELVLDDDRAVAIADIYRRELVDTDRVPAQGEEVRLAEVGAHARGTIFRDGHHLATPELLSEIDRISKTCEGFDIGRYDVKATDAEALRRGEGIRVIELNGVTSEATSIYDARNSVWVAWRTLCHQWGLAFEIGKRRRASGVEVTGVVELVRMWWRYRRSATGR